jgi:GNAT superfamily N-acetyltransferase
VEPRFTPIMRSPYFGGAETPPRVRIVSLAAPDLPRIDVPTGFRAIVRSEDVRAVLARVLDLGGAVTAACAGSVLAGYATDLPFVPIIYCGRRLKRPWDDLPQAHEFGSIEVAPQFRRMRVAEALVAALVGNARLEEKILIGEALLSHWDLRGSGLDVWAYRAALLRLLERAGFERFDTSQPEVALDPASFLIARIGTKTSSESRSAFLARVAGR